METRKLGRADIAVSAICLGTMTWGTQNSADEAHRQIETALDTGINFMDTAEMYPTTPRRGEATGLTERIIGEWIGANGHRRSDYVLATKITGEGDSYVRSGARVTGKTVRCALEQSLGRLKTDYVDLYQLHWPNRGSYHFRKNWKFDPTKLDPGDMECEVAEILGEVANLRKEGKLREFGLSNESAWGLLQFIGVAERDGLPRPVSVQNEYSLLCRLFDLDLAEAATFEDVGLLAYSPLAAGLLSGKYMDGTVPAGSRLSIQPNLNGRLNDVSKQAVKAYREVADRHGLALNQMALAYCLMRPFMTSVIIGATSDSQLSSNIGAAAIRLSDEVVSDIEAVRRGFPMPI